MMGIHKFFVDVEKTVMVSEPDLWYGKNEVEVSLFVTDEFHGQVEVRIFVESVDDLAMVHSVTVVTAGMDFDEKYRKVKEVFSTEKKLFDSIPDTVDVSTLKKMGFEYW